ncbi:DNA polymerase IV [Geodermatophilus sp. Leaf369]|uniref:DNA polymerase IV n=1 Tax=Geodermatophilus sp. Leaf369 TaxID=1736354 RepID=UPI0006F5B6AB|nr:DNA polymerase IV [Geodermatophilus sp. Leaf369]KQS59701.1 DNA polymerase IV [Geodermatophilus sp. Leaf369]
MFERSGVVVERAAGCTVLHVDMDAFFASVEVRRDPSLAGRPVIVGGAGNRGVVTSATYEARAYGVHSAMPTPRALRLCPTAVVVPGDMALYAEVSRGVMAVFRTITPLVEPLSLDEAFLDVSGAGRRLGDAVDVAELVRARVFDEQGITCSVGVAGSKFVAKLASTRSKPDGLMVVRPPEVMDFLHPLPVGALWGVGAKTEELLVRLGLRTVGDLAHVPARTLQRALGHAAGSHLHELAWGRDPRRVVPDEPEKSTGAEETFGTDVDDPVVIHRELLHLSERTAGRLRSTGYVARTITLKVRFSDFHTITRSRTLKTPTDVAQDLYDTARDLFDGLGLDRARIRLVGVRAEGLADVDTTPTQLVLGAREHGRRDAELAADRAARRFGAGAVRPATLLRRDGVVGRSQAVPRPDRPDVRRIGG